MSAKSPSFQFYPRDFLADGKVSVMSCEEIGAYLLLLCHQWLEGHVPDPDRWASICRVPGARMRRMLANLEPCFPAGDDGCRRNPRLETVRRERSEFVDRQRWNGSKGGRPRKNPYETQAFPNANRDVTDTATQSTTQKNLCSLQSATAIPPHPPSGDAPPRKKNPAAADADFEAATAWREAQWFAGNFVLLPDEQGAFVTLPDKPKLPERTDFALGAIGAYRLRHALKENQRDLGFARREFMEAWHAWRPPQEATK